MATIIDAQTAISTGGLVSGLEIVKQQYADAAKLVRQQANVWIDAERQAAAAVTAGHAAMASSLQGFAAIEKATLQTLAADSNKAAVALKEVAAAQVDLGNKSVTSGFNMRYAFFGVKDLLEGRFKFAIAEAANEVVRMGGAIQGIGIGVAVFAAVGYGIYKIVEHAKEAEEAARKLQDGFHAITATVEASNDALQVTVDKLQNTVAKIGHKPENLIKLAVDETIVEVDKLGEHLDVDIKKLEEFIKKEGSVGFWGGLGHSAKTEGVEKEVSAVTPRNNQIRDEERSKLLQLQVAVRAAKSDEEKVTAAKALSAEQTTINTRLTESYNTAIRNLNGQLQDQAKISADANRLGRAQRGHPTLDSIIESADPSKKYADIITAIKVFQDEKLNIQLNGDRLSAEATVKASEADKAAATEQKRLYSEAESAARKADADALEDLKLKGATLGQQEAILRREIASQSQYTDVVRTLTGELIHVREEETRAVERVQKKGEEIQKKKEEADKKDVEHYKKYFDELDKLLEANGKKEEEAATRIAEIRAKSKADIAEVGAKGTAQDAELAIAQRKADLEQQYGLQVEHTTAQEIQHIQQIAALDEQARNEKIAGLRAIEEIERATLADADAKIAIDKLDVKAVEEHAAAMKKIAELQQQINQLTQQNVTAGVQATTKALQVQEKQYAQFFQQLNTGFTQAFNSMITGQRNFGQQFTQMIGKMELAFIDSVVKMALKFIEYEIMKTVVHQAATANQVVTTAAGTAATNIIHGTSFVKWVNIEAAKAAIGAYNAIVGIPIVGPILAPIAATVSGLAVESLALLAFEKGSDYVPRTGPAIVHVGERIIPAAQNAAITQALTGGGGGAGSHTFNFGNISVGAGGSKQQGADVATSIKAHLRRMNVRMAT